MVCIILDFIHEQNPKKSYQLLKLIINVEAENAMIKKEYISEWSDSKKKKLKKMRMRRQKGMYSRVVNPMKKKERKIQFKTQSQKAQPYVIQRLAGKYFPIKMLYKQLVYNQP